MYLEKALSTLCSRCRGCVTRFGMFRFIIFFAVDDATEGEERHGRPIQESAKAMDQTI